jgi:hypothetical protein
MRQAKSKNGTTPSIREYHHSQAPGESGCLNAAYRLFTLRNTVASPLGVVPSGVLFPENEGFVAVTA